MMICSRSCARALWTGSKMKPMPPPAMPPSIQKPQKSFLNSSRTRRMSVSVKKLLAHGMIVWIGSWKLRVTSTQRLEDLIQNSSGFQTALPLGVRTKKIFFRDHLQDWADVLGHATVN